MTTAQISAESTMREVLEAYPGAQRAMMRRYHIGGCSNCGFSPDETLAGVLGRHNVLNTDEVIEHIRNSHEQDQQIQLSPKELADALKGENAPKLLDVRTPDEFEIARLEGAQLMTQELMQEMMSSWDKSTPLVTCCHHGVRSLEAASYLIGHGFTNVRSLQGGIDAWSQEIDSSIPRY